MTDLLKEQFDKIYKEQGPAWSFPPGERPPDNAEEIYREKRPNGDTYIYYQDKSGKLWYKSARIEKFDEEMRLAQRIRKMKKRMGR